MVGKIEEQEDLPAVPLRTFRSTINKTRQTNNHSPAGNHVDCHCCIMPNITLIRSHLFEAIGRNYSDKEFDELCFEFGVEVDDVATEVIEVVLITIRT